MNERVYRVVIVDDEPVARRRVARLLARHPDFVVADSCSGGVSAVQRIQQVAPDLAFLDVQMPDLDGFGVVAAVGAARMPPVVFTTAYEEYALRAFEIHAVDYLLKPFSEARFDEMLAEVRRRFRDRAADSVAERLDALLSDVTSRVSSAQPLRYHDRVAVKTGGNTRIVPIADVDWFETDGNYVRVHVAGRRYLIRNTAARLEQTLNPAHFARIHRRFVVNLARVSEIEPWPGGDAIVHLRDGSRLRLSRTYRDAFLSRMLGDHGTTDEPS